MALNKTFFSRNFDIIDWVTQCSHSLLREKNKYARKWPILICGCQEIIHSRFACRSNAQCVKKSQITTLSTNIDTFGVQRICKKQCPIWECWNVEMLKIWNGGRNERQSTLNINIEFSTSIFQCWRKKKAMSMLITTQKKQCRTRQSAGQMDRCKKWTSPNEAIGMTNGQV